MKNDPIGRTSLDLPVYRSGKVRDMYDLGEMLLMVATDRVSAFDCVLPDPVPLKGKVLNQLSAFWFKQTADIVPNHMISTKVADYPEEAKKHGEILEGRSMLVRKTGRIDIECVVRGYISGSAWKEYRKTGSVCGISLPEGLKEGEKLPQPIFTPASKSDTGHDINISMEEMEKSTGRKLARELADKSIRIYLKASKMAREGGIIIADTKFEFGICEGEPMLIDEALTPDSSRFWPLEKYTPGEAQESFDKQPIRDYLDGTGWDKNPPAPPLPPEIIRESTERYLEAYRRITGKKLAD